MTHSSRRFATRFVAALLATGLLAAALATSATADVASNKRYAKGYMPTLGFDPATQFPCLEQLWTRVSGWNETYSGPDGSYGIPGANPGSKMATEGADWLTNATTQIRWGLKYIKARYGTPCAAWQHYQDRGWY